MPLAQVSARLLQLQPRHRRRLTIWAASLLILLTAAQVARPIGDDEEEEATDKPAFTLNMQSIEFGESLEDFRRFAQHDAWERAFETLEKLRLAPADKLVASGGGICLPLGELLRSELVNLSPAGREAYRVFFDAEAKRLLADAENPPDLDVSVNSPNEIDRLAKLYSVYFITSVGDQIADRLGDLYFERGDVTLAIRCWQSILEQHPESMLSAARLRVKIGTAMAQERDWAGLQAIAREVRERAPAERITIGGKKVLAAEYLEQLAARQQASVAARSSLPDDVTLPATDEPRWQFRANLESPKRNRNANNNDQQPTAEVVPAPASDGRRLFFNWYGVHLAIDVETGKLLWRNGKFEQILQRLQQYNQHQVERFGITNDGSELWTVFRDPKDQNYNASFQLARWDGATGKQSWSSSGSLAKWNFGGNPLIHDDRVVATASLQEKPNELHCLAVDRATGRLLWSIQLGTFQAEPNHGYNVRGVQASVSRAGGRVVVDTHSGGLIALEPVNGQIEWAVTYDAPQRIQSYDFFEMQRSPRIWTAGAPLVVHDTLYSKGMLSPDLLAIDLTRPRILWKRPIGTAALPVAVDGDRLYLAGEELMALDLTERRLLWSNRLPPTTSWLWPLVTRSRIYQFTPRGIYEIDRATGDSVHIFRGADRDSHGGRLVLVGSSLLTISNLAVTAYPVRMHSAEASP
jgi:outer membrane protein assembly factor BamB